MTTTQRLRACWLAFVVLLAGCANTPTATLPPASEPAIAAQFRDQYVIGPGDSLDIFVWHNPDLTRTTPVQPDGQIAIPLVGNVVAVGKTPAALSQEVQDKLKSFIQDPIVTITPSQFVGVKSRQIRVIGEAAQPKAIPYVTNMTALDVMIQVGGLTKYADGDRAVLVRDIGGKEKSYRLRLDSLIQDGDISQNVEMAPGDVIIIPQRYF
jgi:polysaccharide biosynthesis/export protein